MSANLSVPVFMQKARGTAQVEGQECVKSAPLLIVTTPAGQPSSSQTSIFPNITVGLNINVKL